MNYQQKYKQALERARVYHTGGSISDAHITEVIFPELKESEDERIRQYLINAVEEQVDIHQDWKEKCLNWLKERKPEEDGWLFEEGKWYVKLCHNYDGDLRHFQKGDVYQAISETCITDGYHHTSLGSWEIPYYFRPANKDEIPQKIEQSEDEKIRKRLIDMLKNDEKHYQEEIAWLEKQGERDARYDNLEELLRADTIYQMAMNDAMVEEAKTKAINALSELEIGKLLGIEKQCEHKSSYKTEPKFKVEKWIINKESKEVFYIRKNLANSYEIVDIEGDDYHVPHYTLEEDYDLWTIQDAKDGDVLAWDDSKCIALFKNIYDEDSFNSYGLVGNCTGIFEPRQAYHDIEGAHPATKEQRDLFFEKMKEARYEWDAEKKEVKKIEHKALNADKVVGWLENNLPNAYGFSVANKFKQDFGL